MLPSAGQARKATPVGALLNTAGAPAGAYIIYMPPKFHTMLGSSHVCATCDDAGVENAHFIRGAARFQRGLADAAAITTTMLDFLGSRRYFTAHRPHGAIFAARTLAMANTTRHRSERRPPPILISRHEICFVPPTSGSPAKDFHERYC